MGDGRWAWATVAVAVAVAVTVAVTVAVVAVSLSVSLSVSTQTGRDRVTGTPEAGGANNFHTTLRNVGRCNVTSCGVTLHGRM